MKTPKLGQIVLFAVLSNEASQSFVSAAGGPVGEAVVAPMPGVGGFRAATVVSVGKDSASLLVYKQPGDPYRDNGDANTQRLGDVPYNAKGVPGTFLFEEDAEALAKVKAKPTATDLKSMSKDVLFAHAKTHDIDLGEVTTLKEALPLVAKHHGVELPA